MSTCPECAQLLSVESSRCPRCGHDLRTRRLAPERRSDHDDQQDADELLAAVVAAETPKWSRDGVEVKRPPLVAASPLGSDATELRDLVPAQEKKPFWRRRR